MAEQKQSDKSVIHGLVMKELSAKLGENGRWVVSISTPAQLMTPRELSNLMKAITFEQRKLERSHRMKMRMDQRKQEEQARKDYEDKIKKQASLQPQGV